MTGVKRHFEYGGAFCLVESDPDHRSNSLLCPAYRLVLEFPIRGQGDRVEGTDRAESKVLLVIRGDDGMVCGVNLCRCELVARRSGLLVGHVDLLINAADSEQQRGKLSSAAWLAGMVRFKRRDSEPVPEWRTDVYKYGLACRMRMQNKCRLTFSSGKYGPPGISPSRGLVA